MNNSPYSATKTSEDLAKELPETLEQIVRTERPVLVTMKGKPAIVILDLESYEKQLHTLNLTQLLLQAEVEISQGKTQPFEKFMSEFHRANQVSS